MKYLYLGIIIVCFLLLGCVIISGSASAINYQSITGISNAKEITVKGCWGFTLCKDPKGKEISLPAGAIVEYKLNPLKAIVIYPNGERVVYKTSEKDVIPVPGPNGRVWYASPFTVFEVPSGSLIYALKGITYVYGPTGKLLLIQVNMQSPKLQSLKEESTNNASMPTYNGTGWIAQANDWHIKELSGYLAYWNVPALPPEPNSSEVLFIFNGIEPQTGGKIIQPVLQYNWGGSGKWEICSWYVGAGFSVHTKQIPTSPGDTVKGVLYLNFAPVVEPNDTQSSNLLKSIEIPQVFTPYPRWYWTIITMDVNTGNYVSLKTVDNFIGYRSLAVFLTLEAGNVVWTVGNLPGSNITFYKITLDDFGKGVSPNWYPQIDPYWKGILQVNINSSSNVTIVINRNSNTSQNGESLL